MTCKEQQQNLTEETKCKESIAPEDKVVTPDEKALSDPKEQEEETEQKPHEDGYNDERAEIDPASEENTVDTNKSEDTSLRPAHGEEMDDKILELQEDTGAAKSTDAAGKDEEKAAVEADTPPGQGAKNNKERESSVSELIEQAEESAVPDNAEALTPTETMEMKAESSEEQEALSCEEAPVSDAERRQQGDSKGRAAASETEVTAENSSSSPEGRGDTTVENRAEASGNNANDESNKDDIKKGEAEEVSAGETRKENLLEMHELEEAERSVEKEEKVEEKCDEDIKEQEDQTNPDEIAESVTTEERAVADNKIKTETRVENEMISELTKSDSNMEGKKYEKAENEEAAIEEKADEWERTEKDEDGERVRHENDEEEKEATADTTNEGEKMSATNKAADEENNEAEKEEKDQNESEAGQSEAAKNGDEEEKVETDETAEGEGILETLEESANAELSDNAKMLDKNVVESDSVVDCEVASAACETAMTEEMQTNRMEVQNEKKETERGSNNENGKIDAENGEISSGVENKSHEDEGEAQSEAKRDAKTEERIEEIKTDDPTGDESIEVNEVTVVGDNKMDQALVTEREVTEGNDSGEMHEGSAKNNWEPATSGTESPSDDRKDESCNITEPDHETRDLDLMRKDNNVQNNDRVTSPGDEGQSSTPIAVDLNDTAHKCDDSTELSKTDKRPQTDAAATDLSAVKGENGDPEEASKASEEGASVLLKPAAQSLSITQKEESTAVGGDFPEALAKEDNTDLVSNWVTTHQASRFFETFVEPLDDLKETDAQVTHSTGSTEHLRSASPLKMLMPKDVNDSRDKTREEPFQLEPESNHSKDGELCEEDPVRDVLQVQETEVTDLIPEAETEQNDQESVNGHDVPEEDKGQEGLMQDSTEQTAVSKTEMESIAGTHHSVTSGRPESVSEDQTEQKTADPDRNKKQTRAAEMRDLLPSSETEECCEFSVSPEWLSKVKKKEPEETWENGGEFTEVTALREDVNQEESCRNDAQLKPSDESINGDGRDVRLIDNIQHPLSKDRLSPFSVDETLFGPSSYPLLTVVRTESGH